ncbi:MAG: carbohydrate binding domain-containing protein [Gemmataceae bacterium]
MFPRFPRLALIVLVVCAARVQAEERPGWFPFVLPWDDRSENIISVASLNTTPAGKDGFVQVGDGHFVDGMGQRVRFLGVNMVFNANFPHKKDAGPVAARMRKFGINVIRFHHMDYYHAPNGIFARGEKGTRILDADQVDRLDYFVYQLKQQGIYTNINLLVSRPFHTADGLPQTNLLPDRGKIVNYFHPHMIELQKEFAQQLLDRVNPYTKQRYLDDPAVAFIELTNENTLLGASWDGQIDRLPEAYRVELQKQWNAWLRKKHGTQAGLARAWKVSETERGPELLKVPIGEGVAPWHLEKHMGAAATAERVEGALPKGVNGPLLRVRIENKSKQNWYVQFSQAGLDLENGTPYTLTFHARADRTRALNVGASLAVPDWRSVGLQRRIEIGTAWQEFRLPFTPSRTIKGKNRVGFHLGDTEGTVELAGISLRSGETAALPAGSSLERGTVPLGQPGAGPAGQDWIRFLMDTEIHYLETMKSFLKEKLRARALVCCTQASYGGLGGVERELKSDYIDMHAYWQHPQFPRRPWDPGDWTVGTAPLTWDRWGGALASLARYRVMGRPFSVSEYNYPAPADQQAQCVPMLAALAAFQDWDALYLFDYNGNRDDWANDQVRNFFSIDTNPAKMAFLPGAALMFRRGDLTPAPGDATLVLPRSKLTSLMARSGPGSNGQWERQGGAWPRALLQRIGLRIDNTGEQVHLVDRKVKAASASRLVSQGAGTDQARFIAEWSSGWLLAGHLGEKYEGIGWSVVHKGPGPSSAVLTLQSRDGKPLRQARSLVLTAVARVENEGMGWNAERTSVGRQWGKGPVHCEAVAAEIRLKTAATRVRVHGLDPTGKRQTMVPSEVKEGELLFTIKPEHRSVWFEIEAEE